MKLAQLPERIRDSLPSFVNWPWLRPWKRQIYYKVVIYSEYWGQYHSCSPCVNGNLNYHTDRYTHMIPGSLGLFVFGNLQQAKYVAQINRSVGHPAYVFTCYLKGLVVKADYVLGIDQPVSKSFLLEGATRSKRLKEAENCKTRESYTNWLDRVFMQALPYSYTVSALKLKECVCKFEKGRIDNVDFIEKAK